MRAMPAPRVRLSTRLALAFEGELGGLSPQERREQYRRQMQMLHGPLANLLLALALLQSLDLVLALGLAWGEDALAGWKIAGVAVLLALATTFRRLVSTRRRRWVGLGFLGVLVACLAGPALLQRDLPLMSLAGLLLLPVAVLPLLVRPAVAYSCLGGFALAAAGVAWQLEAPSPEKLAFGVYFLASSVAGLVLRRARANLAVRLGREVEALWQRAVSDGLTGLLNRQGWMNLAGTALDEAVAAGRQPAVLFIDVDHFKRTNDRHGHLVGDELLRDLGMLIERRLGEGELAARLGGEEFACLVPDADAAAAQAFAQRIADDYRERAGGVGSTLSVGIALHQPGDVLNDLLARADAALYQAKRRGRDQVVFAE